MKRYNNNQKGNVIDDNNNIAVKMNRKLFEYGNRTTTVKHAQLRMKCSLLSGHLYDLHVVDSPACLIVKILITSSLIIINYFIIWSWKNRIIDKSVNIRYY